jgi:hypothetical protein
MTQLTFQACIFSGVVCSECGAAFDNGQLHPTVVSLPGRHAIKSRNFRPWEKLCFFCRI